MSPEVADSPKSAPSRNSPFAGRALLLLALALAATIGWTQLGAKFVAPAGPYSLNEGGVHPLSNPIAPGDEAAFVRPLATLIAFAIPGARAEIPEDADRTERTRIEIEASREFARGFQKARLALLLGAVFAAYLFLTAIAPSRGNVAAGIGAMLVAVSPWSLGAAPMVAGLGDQAALLLILVALAAYSYVAADRPADMWVLAPVVWIAATLALWATEAGLLIVPMLVVIDIVLIARGMPAGLLLKKRFLSTYLPFGLLTVFVVAVSPLRTHLGELIGGMPQQALVVAAAVGGLFDTVPYIVPGRDPHGMGWTVRAGIGVAILIVPLLWALAQRRPVAIGLSVVAALSWVGASLPGIGPLAATPTIALLPATFTLLGIAVSLATPVERAAKSPSAAAAAPAGSVPIGSLLGGVALAMLLIVPSTMRITADSDPIAVLERSAEARDRSPEVGYLAFSQLFREARIAQSAERKQAFFVRAQSYLVEALSQYRQLRASDPDGAILLTPRAFGSQLTMLLASGKREEATQFVRDLSVLEPDVPEHKVRLALLLFAGGETDEAGRVLAEGLKELESPEAAFVLAQEAATQGNAVAAERFLEVYLDWPDLTSTQRARAQLARGSILHAQSRWDEAIVSFEEAMQDDLTALQARELMLDTQVRVGNWDRVEELSWHEGDPETVQPFREYMTTVARTRAQRGDVDGARETLEGLLSKSTTAEERAEVYLEMAEFEVAQRQPIDAMDRVREAIAETPRDPATYLMLARIQGTIGLPREAEKTLRDGTALAEPVLPVMAQLGSLMISEGRSSEAINLLEGFVRNLGDDAPTEAHRILGAAYGSGGIWQEAVAQFALAYEKTEPTDRPVALAYGNALREVGRHEDAARVYAAYLAQHADDLAVYLPMADAFMGMGDYESAGDLLAKAVVNSSDPTTAALTPRSVPLLVKWAEVLLADQNLPVAKRRLEQALKLEPRYQPALALMDEIRQLEERAEELRAMQAAAKGAPVAETDDGGAATDAEAAAAAGE